MFFPVFPTLGVQNLFFQGLYLPVNTTVKNGYRPKPSNPAGWRHQAITWLHVDFSSERTCGIHLRVVLQWVPRLLSCIMNLKMIFLKLVPCSAAYRYAVYRITSKNVMIRLPVCQNVWKRYTVSYHFTPKIINFGQLCNVVHTAHAWRNNLTLKEVFLSIEIWFQTTFPPFSHLVGDFPKQGHCAYLTNVLRNMWTASQSELHISRRHGIPYPYMEFKNSVVTWLIQIRIGSGYTTWQSQLLIGLSVCYEYYVVKSWMGIRKLPISSRHAYIKVRVSCSTNCGCSMLHKYPTISNTKTIYGPRYDDSDCLTTTYSKQNTFMRLADS